MIRTSGKFFERLRARLKRENKKFKTLSKGAQRLQIAQDVLTQLAMRRIRPESNYFSLSDGLDEVAAEADQKGLDLSEIVAQTTCHVCGIGSVFVAAVQRADKCKLSDMKATGNTRDFETDYLKRWFSLDQLGLIEAYYECHDSGSQYYSESGHDSPFDSEWDVRSPIHRQKSPNKRMKMIMENIISNRGKFDPTKGQHRFDS